MDIKRLITAIIICLGVIAIPVASAAESNWYVGAGTGSTDVDASALDDDSGQKFYGGYQFTDRYALEGGYTDLGSFDIDVPLVAGDVEVDGIQVAGVASFPLRDRFSIFGKAGIYMWDSDVSVPVLGSSDDGTDIMYGFGLNYGAGNWGVRGEWEHFDADDDVDMLSVGVIYRR
ncbi:MAG: porin family protein [Gammaproteobacteria bacterium]|nr:porin family protein [Gammaproteobacteria bacterium]